MLCAILGKRRPGGGSRARGYESVFWGGYIRRLSTIVESQRETGHQKTRDSTDLFLGVWGTELMQSLQRSETQFFFFDGKIGAAHLDG